MVCFMYVLNKCADDSIKWRNIRRECPIGVIPFLQRRSHDSCHDKGRDRAHGLERHSSAFGISSSCGGRPGAASSGARSGVASSAARSGVASCAAREAAGISNVRTVGAHSLVSLNRVNKALLPVRLSNVVAGGGGHGLVQLLDGRQPELGQGDGRVRELVFQSDMAALSVVALEVVLDPSVDGVVGGFVSDGGAGGSDEITIDLPIVGILVPDNGTQTHLPSNSTDTIVNITIWRTPALGCDSQDLLDYTHPVVELGNDLRVGESGHVRVGPGVNTDGVSVVQSTLRGNWRSLDPGTNIEQVGLLVFVVEQEVVQVGLSPLGVLGSFGPKVHGTVIICQPPSVWDRTEGNIRRDVVNLGSKTCTIGPPAVRVGGGVGGFKVGSAGWGCGGNVSPVNQVHDRNNVGVAGCVHDNLVHGGVARECDGGI